MAHEKTKAVDLAQMVPVRQFNVQKGDAVNNILSLPPEMLRKSGSTAIDVLSLPEFDDPKKAFHELVKRYAKLDVNNPEDIKKIIKAYKEAREFFCQLMVIPPEKLPDTLKADVSTYDDLLDIFQTTPRYGTKTGNLNTRYKKAFACALVKLTYAFLEAYKYGAVELREKTKAVFDAMNADLEVGDLPFAFEGGGFDDCENVIMREDNKDFKAKICSRTKSIASIVGKMLRKPEYDAKEAMKDGVGMMFEVPANKIYGQIFALLEYFRNSKRFKFADNCELEVEVSGMDFTQKQERDLINQLRKISRNHAFKRSNRAGGRYRGVNIVLKGLSVDAHENVSIEIQIVPQFNKNERGASHHRIYEIVRDITMLTRLFGGINEFWIKRRLNLALDDILPAPVKTSKMDEYKRTREKTFNNLFKYLTREDNRIGKRTDKNDKNRVRYFSVDILATQIVLGLVDYNEMRKLYKFDKRTEGLLRKRLQSMGFSV